MARRKISDSIITETFTAAEKYIAEQIDGTDWEGMLNEHGFCQECPVRTGPHVDEDGVPQNYCLGCPLREWLMTTATLHMRSKAFKAKMKLKKQLAEQEGA